MILGIPTYGRTFTLRDPAQNKVGDFHSGPGKGGPYTNEAGMIGYNELCEKQKANHWLNQWDAQQKVPYTQSENQWISYDNEESVGLKTKLALDLRLGGAMVWSIETDDFRGICYSGKYPLLNTIKKVLNGAPPPLSSSLPSTTVEEESTTNIVSTSTGESTSSESISSTSSETSLPTSSTSHSPPFACVKDGIFKDVNDCSAFNMCSNLIAYHFRCPTPLLFDDNQKKCNWPSNVVC